MQRSRSRLSRALAALTITTLGAFLIPGTLAEATEDPAFKVLLFTKTAAGAYRHGSIGAAVQAFNELGEANNFEVDESADANVFNTTTLNTYDAVVMLQSSGMVWDTEAQRTAAQDYVRSGHGIVALHNATDMNIEQEFPWWDQVVMGGAHMTAHSSIVSGTAKVADKVHPSTTGLPDRWVWTEEWYNFDKSQRGDVHVLVTADETTYNAGSARMGADHPISWCRVAEGGKVWATAMGHQAAAYADPLFRQHLLGGLQWAAGAAQGDCGGTDSSRYQKVTLDGAPDQPMQLDVAPDGEVFYISRSGKVNVIHTHDGASETHVAGELDVYDGGEDGGIGLALDPNFATNRWIYINHSPAGTAEINRVTRFTVSDDDTLDMASARTVIEVPAFRGSDEPGHTGGGLNFGPGGNLYIGVGDDTNPFASNGYTPIDERSGREKFDAQRSSANTNDLRGKILRVHPEAAGGYSIPSGNLFAPGTALTRPEIYAMGFRNSFRFAVDPETGWISAADYGPDAQNENPNRGPAGTVEWNLIKAPGFYGWPYCVGDNSPFNDYNFATRTSGPAFSCSAPVNNSPNNTGLTTLPAAKAATVWYDYGASAEFPEIDVAGGAAPMGGPFYHYDAASTSDRKFPEYFDGTPFFYEWSRNFVKEFRLDSAGDLLKINPFAAELGLSAPIDMKFGPDGAMYLAEWGYGYGGANSDDGIYRIDYVTSDRAPLAKVSATPDSGQTPLQVTFSSAGSADPEGGDLTYAWDFGDGGTATDPNPTHTYTTNGSYTARLTVFDNGGKSGSVNVAIVVGNTRPTVTFTNPANGRFIDYGDTISYQINVTDPEDGAIDCSRVMVTAALGHDSHSHDTGRYTGCTGTIPTGAGGHEATANTYVVLSADYTDNGGLRGTTSVVLQPRHKQAEHYTGQSGIQVFEQSGAENGKRISAISNGDWISFNPLNLGGVGSVTFRVAAPSNTGGSIELRAGSPTGALIATSPVPSTGNWGNFVDLAPVAVTDPGGTQTVYAVFNTPTAGSFGLDALTFNAAVQSGSTYTVTSAHSNKRVDVRGRSNADGAAVIQWSANSGGNQRWRLADAGSGAFTLTAQHSNKCLDLVSESVANVQQRACVAGASDQKWRLEPAGPNVYRIVSVLSGKCLDIPQASTANDVQLIQSNCSTTAASQKWRFDQAG
ncbi:ThuA domain-containing protein [Streptomyces zaomyceticus]|uniref:ThuA domain-containing protein n=1 Tax=Streptomyces zaomyceticus TaxID=68286 RepID=UPI0037155C23